MEENDEENEKSTNLQKIKKPKLNENFINFINNKIKMNNQTPSQNLQEYDIDEIINKLLQSRK